MAAKDEAAEKVAKRWRDGQSDISDVCNKTWLTRAYLSGQQWVQRDTMTDHLREMPRNPDRVRATINRMGPDSRRLIAKLTASPLRYEVTPETPDDAARRGAALGTAILGDMVREHDWQSHYLDHAWTTWEGGVGIVWVDWDARAGKEAGRDAKGKRIAIGEPCLTVVSPTEIATTPGTRDIRFAQRVIRAIATPPEEVMERYGLKTEPKADSLAQTTYLTRAMRAGRQSVTPETTTVLVQYERPGPDREGKITHVVGGEVVLEEEWPYPWDDRQPIAVARVVQVPGRWVGLTPAWDAIEVQTLYNASWSSIIEHSKQAGNARLMYPVGSIDDPRSLTDTAGEHLQYNPFGNSKPEWLAPTMLSQWVLDAPAKLEEAMNNILGVQDVSRGKAPSNIESGAGLAILEENDVTPLGSFADQMARCWGDVGRMVLRLCEKYVTERRTARVEIPGRPPVVLKWTGKSLQGQTQAIVPQDAALPTSKAARMTLAMQLLQNFPDDVTFEQFSQIADLPLVIHDTVDPQIAKAERENYAMEQGESALVDEIDDHEKHIAVLERYMLTERFELADDEIQKLIRDHRKAHIQYMASAKGQDDIRSESTGGALAGLPPDLSPPPEIPEGMPMGEPPLLPPDAGMDPSMMSDPVPMGPEAMMPPPADAGMMLPPEEGLPYV